MGQRFSLLNPVGTNAEYMRLPENVLHDIGLDVFCQGVSDDVKERRFIENVLSNISPEPSVSLYRQQIFGDVLRLPELRKTMLELFSKIQWDSSVLHKTSDEEFGLWHLLHRLDALDSYIKTVEAMRDCLSDERIKSEGLVSLRNYITELYSEACFADMKKDISALKIKASDVQSVTLGINVNERFEAVSIGLVSVNKKQFKKSGIVSNFADSVALKDKIRETADWNGDMHYHIVDKEKKHNFIDVMKNEAGLLAVQSSFATDIRTKSTLVTAMTDIENSTFCLDSVVNKMLGSLVKKLRDTLTKYTDIAVMNISVLVPEFVYYVRCAEFIGKLMEKGCKFCEAQPQTNVSTEAKGFYNLRLAVNMENVGEIVPNDIVFDTEHTVYILTGANRGGKTTATQAIGQLFVMAQGGLFVPAESFRYVPCDCVYTHFPTDEDKTMDLGRLGEECVRFRQIFSQATNKSLLLLNETFSTTSFEEGYYIAGDSVRAILTKGMRTVYNTHMHKLGEDTEKFSQGSDKKAASLIMKTEKNRRSFKLAIAKPEGSSYAKDIAEKYGITYDMLINEIHS